MEKKNVSTTIAIENAQKMPTYEEAIADMLRTVECAVSEFNESDMKASDELEIRKNCEFLDYLCRKERLLTLADVYHTAPRADFMRKFLNEREYSGYAIRKSMSTGKLSLNAAKHTIKERDMRAFLNRKEEGSVKPDTRYEISANPVFWKHLPMFYDNVLRALSTCLGGNAPKMNKEAQREFSTEYRAKEGFPVVESLTKLSAQMNALVKEFLPEGMEIPMSSQDVKYIGRYIQARVNGKTLDMKKTDDMVEGILFALQTRMNGEKYEIVSRDKLYKESK